MNEKLKYAEMLEIPQSTCNITFKPARRKKVKQSKTDNVKDKVIEKVNSQTEMAQETAQQNEIELVEPKVESVSIEKKVVKKGRFKITAVGVELCVIGALILTILVSSAIMPNSGITSFFSNAFVSPKSEVVDSRVFSDFEPCFSTVLETDVVNENGIMTIKNQKSVYSPCDGIVEGAEQTADGLYDITIAHSDNFKTIIKGAKYSYVEQGAKVYKTIPVAYAGEQEISVCFVDKDNNVITDNVAKTCSIIWA